MEGRKQSGYERLEEDMVWRQRIGRDGYGCWKDVRTQWSSLLLASCVESLQQTARVKLVGELSACICDCVTSVRGYSDLPIQLGDRAVSSSQVFCFYFVRPF